MPELVFEFGKTPVAVEAYAGETILEAASRAAGLLVDAPCGGRGRCGKCLVFAQGGLEPPGADELKAIAASGIVIGSDDAGGSIRLACIARLSASGSMRVIVRPARRLAGGASELAGASIVVHGPQGDGHFDPPVAEVDVEVDAPALGDPRSDLDRVLEALARSDDAAPTTPSRVFLQTLPSALRADAAASPEGKAPARVRVLRSPTVLLRARAEGAQHPGPPLAAAIDLGTTTVVAQLLDLETGASLGLESSLNAQRFSGADVLSRIQYCMERKDGLEILASRTVGQIENAVRALCHKAERLPADVAVVAVGGNSTMLHLLAGVDPSGIASAPFSPVFTASLDLAASDVGFSLAREARLLLLPGVSAYVGADIVAGLVAADLDRRGGEWLYLDLGTNGEIALGGSASMLCCAAAAGPAFEGAHIERGAASVPGAIHRVNYGDAGLTAETIGGAPPIGICGSGLIDAVSVLLRAGAMDDTGRLLEPDEATARGRALLAPGASGANGPRRVYLDPGRSVWLTQKDLRELQLASAAVAAGVDVLLERRGITAADLAGVVLAGGFGSRLDPACAMDLGLFPSPGSGVVESVGNAAAAGTARCVLSRRDLARVESLAGRMSYIELSSSPRFMEAYMERMVFPTPERP